MRAVHSHYEILGVSRTASTDDVRAAYRRLLRTCHPDLGGSSALFDLVNEAYAVLTAPAERARYDRGLTAPTGSRPAARPTLHSRRPAAATTAGATTPTRTTGTAGTAGTAGAKTGATAGARLGAGPRPAAPGTTHVGGVDYAALRRSRSSLWRPQPGTAYAPEPVATPQLVSLYL